MAFYQILLDRSRKRNEWAATASFAQALRFQDTSSALSARESKTNSGSNAPF